jgi:hypothetical protein
MAAIAPIKAPVFDMNPIVEDRDANHKDRRAPL